MHGMGGVMVAQVMVRKERVGEISQLELSASW